MTPKQFTSRQKLIAWGVHLFTASSVVWGFLAILAIQQRQWWLAVSWGLLAIIVDAFDGVLSRRARVKEVLPQIDGTLLDNMVDYFTYVIVAAFFLYEAQLVPPQFSIAAASIMMLTSAYQFTQVDAKTEDHYFKGFPSYWNIVVFYMFILRTPSWLNLAALLFFAVLIFVPILYVYPSRTVKLWKLTIFLTVLWGIVTVAIIFQFPHPQPWLVWTSLLYVVYYFGLSFYHTLQAYSAARQNH